MRSCLALVFLAACAAPSPAPRTAAPARGSDAAGGPTPTAQAPTEPARLLPPRRPVTETLHGITLTDPFRSLENLEDPEVKRWLAAEGARAREALARLPEREAFLGRLRELSDELVAPIALERRRGVEIFRRRDPGSEVFRLYVRDPSGGAPRLLFDPNEQRGDAHHVSIDWAALSPDGRHVALNLSRDGSESGVVRILRVADGSLLPEEIPNALPGVKWLEDATLQYETRASSAAHSMDLWRDVRTKLHTVGRPVADDITVFGRGVDPGIPHSEGDFVTFATLPKSPYLLAERTHGVRPYQEIFVTPKKGYSPSRGVWTKVTEVDDEIRGKALHGQELYLLTTKDAPYGKVLRVPLARPRLDAAETLAVGTQTNILQSLHPAKEGVYLLSRAIAESALVRLPTPGEKGAKVVALPAGVSVGLSTSAEERGARLYVASWKAPPRWFALETPDGPLAPVPLAPPSRFTGEDLEAERVWAKSADGTAVPLSIVRKRGLPLDGKRPTYLTAYGAYGTSMLAGLSSLAAALAERDGVYAVCHVRGGGELGEPWRKAGFQLEKRHTWEDAIGCAQWLIEHRYTSPATLGLAGTSAGGIMVGNAVVARPDLFAAAFMRVGVMNPVRFEATPNGTNNAPEFGTVATPEGLRSLVGMDAYLKVKDGVRYPAVLVEAGMTDPRVIVWQPAKMAARLQEATVSGAPVLLRIEEHAGHGVGSSRSQATEVSADELAFLFAQARKP